MDHVIPQGTEATDLRNIIAKYGLPADFKIEHFHNWVPAHMLCNRRKTDDLYRHTPAMLATLEHIATVAPEAQRIAERVRANNGEINILLKFETALISGAISIEQSQDIIRRAQVDKSGWRVLEQKDGVETVTNGRVVALRPDPWNNDLSWICGNCWQPGPWQGNICTFCGVRSTPD
ncbi:MAG TPA: hypothetical protein VFE35_03845 [Candidatus Cybelea sp.]|nr:hypothetical protein [Candidatus Cybelea sp.]